MKITASSSLTVLASLAIGAGSTLAAPTGSPNYHQDAPRSPDPGSAPGSPSTHSYGQLGRGVPRSPLLGSPLLGGGGAGWGRSSSDSRRFRERVSRGLAKYESRSVSTGATTDGGDTSADTSVTESATGLGIPAIPGGLPSGLGAGLPAGLPSTNGLLPGGLPHLPGGLPSAGNLVPGLGGLPSADSVSGFIPSPYGYLPNGLPAGAPSLAGLAGSLPGGLPSLNGLGGSLPGGLPSLNGLSGALPGGLPSLSGVSGLANGLGGVAGGLPGVGGLTSGLGGLGGLAGGLTGGGSPVSGLTSTVGGLTGGLTGGLGALLPPAVEDTLKQLLGTLGNLPIGTVLSTLGGVQGGNLPHLQSLPVRIPSGIETPMGTPPLPLGVQQLVPQGVPNLGAPLGGGILPGGMPSIPGGLPISGNMIPGGRFPFSLAAQDESDPSAESAEDPAASEEPAAPEESAPSPTPASGGNPLLRASLGVGSLGGISIKDVDASASGSDPSVLKVGESETTPHRGDAVLPSGILSALLPSQTAGQTESVESATAASYASSSSSSSSSDAEPSPSPSAGASIVIKVSSPPSSSQGTSSAAAAAAPSASSSAEWDSQKEKKDASDDGYFAKDVGGASSVAMTRSEEMMPTQTEAPQGQGTTVPAMESEPTAMARRRRR